MPQGQLQSFEKLVKLDSYLLTTLTKYVGVMFAINYTESPATNTTAP